MLDDLFAYRLGGDRYLIVTNSANHEADLAWLGALEPRPRRRRPRRRRPLRDARRAGPARARGSSPGRWASSCRRGCASPTARSAAARRWSAAPGYTGEDGVELLIDPEIAPRDLGGAARRRGRALRARRPRHAAPRGLLPPARQRPDPRPQPDRGRARLVLQGGDRASSAPRPSPAPAPRAPPRSSRRSGSRARASRAPATAVLAERRAGRRSSPAGPSRPRSRSAIGMAYVRADLAEPGTEVEIDVRGKRRAARVASKPSIEPGRRS